MDIATLDTRHSTHIPRILLYSSCIADQLRGYFLTKPDFASKYSIDTLIIHVMQAENIFDLATSKYSDMVKNADIIFTNNFSPRWGNLGTHRIYELKKSSAKVFTWVPPSFTAFWPIMEWEGEHGVVKMIKSGASENDILKAFDDMTFDPLFSQRWNDQIMRLRFKEEDCNIGISDFCVRHHKQIKLWFTENHPTYNLIAWIGCQIAKLIGENTDTEETCLQYDHATTGTWNVIPETRYEFNHYEFAYPLRYSNTTCCGDINFYREMIKRIFYRCSTQKDVFRY